MTITARSKLTSVPAASLERIRVMRSLALASLPRMLTRGGLFCWCIRRGRSGDVPEGECYRYTAMVLVGLAAQRQDLSPRIFGAGHADACCDMLLDRVAGVSNIGDVAMALWAGSAMRRRKTSAALDRLRAMTPATAPCPTVELAWAVTALSFHPEFVTDEPLVHELAQRLKASFSPQSSLFAHQSVGTPASGARGHVSCFADWVYPVQALALYHGMTGDVEAIEIAQVSAAKMCALQGPAGQWWWHFDIRTGQVVERYPVYAVHQDAMAPMALLDLQDACGADHLPAVLKGVDWLFDGPECGGRLMDEQAGLIWRKVARREPGKLVRALQAGASRMHPALRVPMTDLLFPPTRIDWESRPYHMGWLLYAFTDRRLAEWSHEA